MIINLMTNLILRRKSVHNCSILYKSQTFFLYFKCYIDWNII